MHEHDHDTHDDHHDHQPLDYTSWIEQQRGGKDEFFRESHHSPIPAGERDGFTGLSYYAIDLDLRYEGMRLEPVDPSLTAQTQVQTSDGAVRDGRRVGTFVFEVAGEVQRLTALQLAKSQGDALFVPFKDATNGSETYGAGRYLDLEPMPDGTYDLDFNLAYSPFCAYSPSYSCPLPPLENRLAARITAGEKGNSN
jgi:uncharacterized protein (DUF1684 family)